MKWHQHTFYTIVVTAGSFHIQNVVNLPVSVPVLLAFSVLMLIFAGLSVAASVGLIVGLCTNNRLLLLPWIGCISMTTALDVILSLYFISDSEVDPFFVALFIADIFLCALNVYCVLCVTSQYQEYTNGRGRPRQVMIDGRLPAIHFEPASSAPPGALMGSSRGSRSPKCYLDFQGGQRSPTGGHTAPQYRSLASACSARAAAVVQSRSSFSSTSEFSFYSSSDGGLLPGSRRGSALPSQQQQSLSPVGEAPVPSMAEAEISFAGSGDGGSTDQSPASETVVVVPDEDSMIADSSHSAPVLSRFRQSNLFSNILNRQMPGSERNFQGNLKDEETL